MRVSAVQLSLPWRVPSFARSGLPSPAGSPPRRAARRPDIPQITPVVHPASPLSDAPPRLHLADAGCARSGCPVRASGLRTSWRRAPLEGRSGGYPLASVVLGSGRRWCWTVADGVLVGGQFWHRPPIVVFRCCRPPLRHPISSPRRASAGDDGSYACSRRLWRWLAPYPGAAPGRCKAPRCHASSHMSALLRHIQCNPCVFWFT